METVHEKYDEEYSEEARATLNTRRVKVTLTVPRPKPVELVGTVPAEPQGGELKVA